MADLRDSSPVTRLAVKVVPGASSSAIAGWLGDSLRVRVSAVRVSRGQTSARKVLEISGLSKPDIMNRLGIIKYGE